MTFDEYITQTKGKTIDNPQVNTYPGQCVSLVQDYLYNVYDIEYQPRGNGKDFAQGLINQGLATKVGTPKKGDIISYPASYPNADPTYGHVAIYYDSTHMYQQNVGGKQYASLDLFNLGYDSTCTIARVKTSSSAALSIGDDVIISGDLYTSSNASSPAGSVTNKKTKITRIAVGAKHPYNTTGYLGWMDADSIRLVDSKLSVGDSVKVRKGATWYNGSKITYDPVFTNTYKVLELKGDRAVIGFSSTQITGAVDIDDLYAA